MARSFLMSLALLQNINAMIISDDKKLREVKEEFHKKFTHLKIEFYSGSHQRGQGSHQSELLDPELTLGEVRTLHNEGDLRIDPHLAVGEFEQKFLAKYGLNVQVFRKSGNLWMQTTATDSWTLAEQNRKGGASEEAYQEKTAVMDEEED